VQRKMLPDGESGRVEAEDRQRDQRQVQKSEEDNRVNRQPLFHTNCSLSRWRKPHTNAVTRSMSSMETAEPNGQSRAVVTWFCTRFPTKTVRPPPSGSGVRYAPRHGIKTWREPARSPGCQREKMTLTPA